MDERIRPSQQENKEKNYQPDDRQADQPGQTRPFSEAFWDWHRTPGKVKAVVVGATLSSGTLVLGLAVAVYERIYQIEPARQIFPTIMLAGIAGITASIVGAYYLSDKSEK